MIPTFRVSNVAAYARWRDDPDQEDVGWLLNQMTQELDTEPINRGKAFHKFLENSAAGDEHALADIDGYRFVFNGDFELYRPKTREWRQGKDYGGIIISGQCDAIEGNTIYDDKTTSYFEPEQYIEGKQWKYYLDIFGADRFIWNVWVMKDVTDKYDDDEAVFHSVSIYEVTALHRLEQFRFPGMESQCRELALEFKEFAARYLPIEVTQ